MRTLAFILSVLVLSPAVCAQSPRPGPAATLEQIVMDIRDAREVARASADAGLRERLDLLLARAELAARQLQYAAVPQAQPAPRALAMSPGDFTRFMAALSTNRFDDARLATVKTLGHARVTAAQARQILQKFSFDEGKEEAAVFLHPLLVDQHLFAEVLGAMTFPQTRANALKRVAR